MPGRLHILMTGLALFASQAGAQGSVTPWLAAGGKVGALQSEVEALAEGEVLELSPGRHEGPIVVRTPGVTIDGGGDALVDGQGSGTVVTILADRVTLRNLTVAGSGSLHDRLDAGISIQGTKDVTVSGVTIRDALFGIDISASQGTRLLGNDIESKPFELGLRGDAIRLWASKDALVQGNRWSGSRDVVSWYSERVTFSENVGLASRYSLHSMYSKSLIIKGNRFAGNSVGIFIMYGEGTSIIGNRIERSIGAGGMGIGTKETSSLFVKGNAIVYCTTGILVDNSPYQPGTRNWFHENEIAYNGTAVLLSTTKAGNDFRLNRFLGNAKDADSELRQVSASTWKDNYWDHYDGFDRDRDGIGDTAYRIRKYADVLAEQHPMARYFVGSPVLTLIELIQRLVPLTPPAEILVDPSPRLIPKDPEEHPT